MTRHSCYLAWSSWETIGDSFAIKSAAPCTGFSRFQGVGSAGLFVVAVGPLAESYGFWTLFLQLPYNRLYLPLLIAQNHEPPPPFVNTVIC